MNLILTINKQNCLQLLNTITLIEIYNLIGKLQDSITTPWPSIIARSSIIAGYGLVINEL